MLFIILCYYLYFVFHAPILGSLRCERFYLQFCILDCLAVKERLSNYFLFANLCRNMMSLSSFKNNIRNPFFVTMVNTKMIVLMAFLPILSVA